MTEDGEVWRQHRALRQGRGGTCPGPCSQGGQRVQEPGRAVCPAGNGVPGAQAGWGEDSGKSGWAAIP